MCVEGGGGSQILMGRGKEVGARQPVAAGPGPSETAVCSHTALCGLPAGSSPCTPLWTCFLVYNMGVVVKLRLCKGPSSSESP